ncbi:MAG TPA: hypothetical protein VFH17_08245 [Coriobacteriia bacterium]|nr:hypothetical protein [Coriobacteriia bacterium]
MQKVSRPATSFRPRGMMAALLAFAEAMRAQSGMLQRRTRKMPGWEPGRSDDKGRHPGAFGAQGTDDLRRFSWTRYKRWRRRLTRDKSYAAFCRAVSAGEATTTRRTDGLRRYAFPAGYTGPLTPQEKRRRGLREACAAAGMAVRGINA